MASAPKSLAATELSAPLIEPIGVRTADVMTISLMMPCYITRRVSSQAPSKSLMMPCSALSAVASRTVAHRSLSRKKRDTNDNALK